MKADLLEVFNSPALKGWQESRVERSEASQFGTVSSGPMRVPLRRFIYQARIVESVKPIEVALSQGEGCVVAEADALQLSAIGSDVDSAVDELAGQVVHFFHHYTSLRRDQVTGLAARLREIYTTQFNSRAPRVA